ncbi:MULTISPECIES: hypothetical protein [unclassified Halomonas]|uniref:hypothetical protein n=1 Tax=unclassified Halomonas TaxID=2609666 RepID=UPI0007D9BC7B|nr:MULTISPECIES: hypothetical protein [unclassified Halomonas]MBT2788078.1 hypothetical protein [Halomonas sp. ISL-106]MBT2795827.1 hypothetical protein [Halomonas sp. ISL-104]OAL61110.1 hypothetical protein A6R74_16060 [Halomonas sp. ALS9]
MSFPAPPPYQHALDLTVEVERDVNGVEMGVLENGIPYLTQRGLAEASGAPRSSLYDITQEWSANFNNPVLTKDRLSFLKERLAAQGFNEPSLYIEITKDGSPHYAYPDIVCMAIIEYYAFEARTPNPRALQSFRDFSTYGLRSFIYDALQYTPSDKWKYHHDRVSILSNSVPVGYFSIFQEISGLAVDLINAGLSVNDRTIPDISVGQTWAKHWKANELAAHFGERIQYEHIYPEYYPQSMSNPQKPAAYPEAALPEFRRWFRETYLPTKFPTYILKKAGVLSGGQNEAQMIASMYQTRSLPRQ